MLKREQATGTERRDIDAKTSKKVLVGIRVTPNFHRRIRTECVRRNLSLQKLVIEALKLFFVEPVPGEELIEFGTLEPERTQEEGAWNDLWDKYMRVMPREKIEVMTSAMEWDITMRRSSRRRQSVKGSKFKKQKDKR